MRRRAGRTPRRLPSSAVLAEFLQKLGALRDDGGATGRVAQDLPLAAERLALEVELAGRVLPFHPEPLLLEEVLLGRAHFLGVEAREGLLPGGVQPGLLPIDLGLAAARPVEVRLGAVDAFLPLRGLRHRAARAEQESEKRPYPYPLRHLILQKTSPDPRYQAVAQSLLILQVARQILGEESFLVEQSP